MVTDINQINDCESLPMRKQAANVKRLHRTKAKLKKWLSSLATRLEMMTSLIRIE